jgi:integrase
MVDAANRQTGGSGSEASEEVHSSEEGRPQAQATEPTPESVPNEAGAGEEESIIYRYHPFKDTMTPEQWESVSAFTIQAAEDSLDLPYFTNDQLRAYMGYIARLALFVNVYYGLPLRYDTVFSEVTIHNFFEQEVEAGNRAKGSRRSMLTAVGRHLNPAGFPLDVDTRYGYKPSAMPYSAAEVRSIRDWSKSQGDPERNADASVIVGLALGAGLRASEIMSTTGAHVRETRSGLLVKPRGYRGAKPRDVIVTEVFEADLLSRAEEVGDEGYLFKPGSANRKTGVLSTFIKRSRPRCPGYVIPDTRRLRSTWVIDHLMECLPHSVLCAMAGLSDLQHYRPWVQNADRTQVYRYDQLARRVGKEPGVTKITPL